MSSVRAGISGYRSAGRGALLPHPPRLRGLRPRSTGRPGSPTACAAPGSAIAYPDLPSPVAPRLRDVARRAGGRAARDARATRWSSATRCPASSGCTTPRPPCARAAAPSACSSSPRRPRAGGVRPILPFFPVPIDARRVAAAAGETRIVCARDPYCPEGAETLYGGPLGLPVDRLPDGAGHINPDAGLRAVAGSRGLVLRRRLGRVDRSSWNVLSSAPPRSTRTSRTASATATRTRAAVLRRAGVAGHRGRRAAARRGGADPGPSPAARAPRPARGSRRDSGR